MSLGIEGSSFVLYLVYVVDHTAGPATWVLFHLTRASAVCLRSGAVCVVSLLG